jgi:hypothetical protein
MPMMLAMMMLIIKIGHWSKTPYVPTSITLGKKDDLSIIIIIENPKTQLPGERGEWLAFRMAEDLRATGCFSPV